MRSLRSAMSTPRPVILGRFVAWESMIQSKTSWLVLVGCVVFVVVGVYLLRKPQVNAKHIRIGDSIERVHQIMGSPTEVYYSTAELRGSILYPMSYVFRDLAGNQTGIPANELPDVKIRVEWFEWLSAGTLVYYDENGVTEIYWGGT